MRKVALVFLVLAVVVAAAITAVVRGSGPTAANASSHREAPLISQDPSADNTDLYAFRSVDQPDFLTIISNWIPAEDPAAGPMYYEFSPTARYNINIDTNGDGVADVVYRAQFKQSAPVAFLRATAQPFTLTREKGGQSSVVAQGTTPPDNVGPRTTPNYPQLAAKGIYALSGGGKVFAGQREDAFFGDIGAIFDSLGFRRGTGSTGGGKDFFAGYNVHAIALQIPISQIDSSNHIVGVWASTDRQQIQVRTVSKPVKVKVRVLGKLTMRTKSVRSTVVSKPWIQVSRLGNPLFNEVIVPTELKDKWNSQTPAQDSEYVKYVTDPILAGLINKLYPGVVNAPEHNRDDLVQVLLTGVPNLNFTGSKPLDELRVNLATPPTSTLTANRLGVLGGDNQGYPNGRRLGDDVIDIAEMAVAGALKGNPVSKALGDGVNANDVASQATFPYEADPFQGFDNQKGQQKP
jgi:hypothetical protein